MVDTYRDMRAAAKRWHAKLECAQRKFDEEAMIYTPSLFFVVEIPAKWLGNDSNHSKPRKYTGMTVESLLPDREDRELIETWIGKSVDDIYIRTWGTMVERLIRLKIECNVPVPIDESRGLLLTGGRPDDTRFFSCHIETLRSYHGEMNLLRQHAIDILQTLMDRPELRSYRF